MSAPVQDPHAPWHRGRWGQDHWPAGPPRSSARVRLLLPVFVSLLIQVPFAAFALVRGGVDRMSVVGLGLAIVGPLVLLGARRFPGPTVAVIAVIAALDVGVAQALPSPPYIALTFAIVGAIVRGARLWAWISVGATWVITIVIGLAVGAELQPARIAATTLLILIVFGIGEAIRTRSEHYAQYQQALIQRRHDEVQAERTRIARELHDVLAHSLSQINVQAGVGLHLMDAHPEKAKEALASIKDSSKSALDEVRSLLGVLRADSGQDAPLVPEPDLARLPGLIDSVRTQGLDVTLEMGIEDAPKATQLAIYRIVQESLTNVVRHAGADRAIVSIRSDADATVIEIADDGRGLDPLAEGGRGLLGMHERTELLGGTLTTGRSSLGGALVTARIPTKETSA
ncbi:sensor histidine kinase [Leifsonia sp. H3M29-4]|uniref:sensor histidine kinase n=1 Tax=Salinibacterium metalliresistens TaxID=3031321 RepID=UPI0023DBD7B6|nr:sensor histidine kinase [Salinibacterium metalliresistens]MDF1478908.1 sensor histidine kinase [Salinibacterium metalliresistens]